MIFNINNEIFNLTKYLTEFLTEYFKENKKINRFKYFYKPESI